MFSEIALNIETPITDRSYKFKSQFEFGQKNWQRKYKSTHSEYYTPLEVYSNNLAKRE
jgi:hypothetical protein